MEIFHITPSCITQLADPNAQMPPGGFLWIDATHEEVTADTQAWRDAIERMTNVHVYDLHLTDAINLNHPSYFDSTQEYAMVVFRKLALDGSSDARIDTDAAGQSRKIPPALTKLATRPVTFMLMEGALVTVHASQSRTIEGVRARLLEQRARGNGNGNGNNNGNLHVARLPSSPAELMLRLLNVMVDQYLALRQPLSGQIDRWQRALLNPRSRFNDWMALLDARVELRKLDHLCEGQRDALQELRDYLVDTQDEGAPNRGMDLLLVRINDVMEHITRVLTHAQRMEASIESAVQIHFSAMAHRTSEIMRTLTVITALFMPLTLITGIFGMNFDEMPLLKDALGFWITIGLMGVIVAGLLLFFHRKRYLEDKATDEHR
ncbi:magnesium transporter CorA family protein [Noviherbaspirillum sp. CPCC 100848]|uniref:Magnesium transporter CorA family protein n=1 Tax=Noviherbaspirillum album TaxID=3080276 RepID=A0ABU6JD26_9BURK|nr:magnesium transporter CorA family protein [Noviherbaspirillum sp. CPCC 100848]MEC4721554.1 magnesium transporter CorA family protein [Noviherbaspirillum sp. CPCC 100848]